MKVRCRSMEPNIRYEPNTTHVLYVHLTRHHLQQNCTNQAVRPVMIQKCNKIAPKSSPVSHGNEQGSA